MFGEYTADRVAQSLGTSLSFRLWHIVGWDEVEIFKNSYRHILNHSDCEA